MLAAFFYGHVSRAMLVIFRGQTTRLPGFIRRGFSFIQFKGDSSWK